jgi:peptidoglycan biosynthesis protein MviN/MurJ (putative lipid II flippase)
MSIVAFSQRVAIALGAVISLGAYVIAAKTSSDSYRDGGLSAIKKLANRETFRIICLGLVAWGLFSMLGLPMLAIIFRSSKIPPGDLNTLLSCISAIIVGVGPMSTVPYLFRVLYSISEYRLPAVIGSCVPIAYAFVGQTLAPKLGPLSLAVSFATVWWLAFIATLLALTLKRENY